MDYGLLLRTVSHLKPLQVFYQVKYRLKKPAYVALESSIIGTPKMKTAFIAKYKCAKGDVFSFLNMEHPFAGWNFTDNGMLWAYNQNYFDWINQEDMSSGEGCKWIDRFIDELPSNKIGLDPYPIALRSINWIKFFCRFPENATKPRLDSLCSQVKLLEKQLEYHLLGNHLLEDACALYIAASFFQDEKLLKKATKLLLSQMEEQTLPDGAHYEQSPMYHSILLDRLLDCINIAPKDELKAFAQKQLGWLRSICYQDGSFPFFNDTALGIAPVPNDIIDYARRLGIESEATPLKESGYRKISNSIMEVFVDVGNITASYQPGHSHADTFNYELRIDGQPVIVDTGISTYNKDARRQYERSTAAHNTVVVGGQDSSRVWGGFRMGRRAEVTVLEDKPNELTAYHNGFGRQAIHQRRFFFNGKSLCVEDEIIGRSGNEAVSYVHFSPGIHVKFVSEPDGVLKAGDIMLKIKYFKRLQLKKDFVSSEYNNLQQSFVLEMKFAHLLQYEITKTTEQ